MPLTDQTRKRIETVIASSRVVLFMKGDREQPQCGFSASVVGILDGLVPDYVTCDVLEDPEIREGIKEYSSWPTIPQLFVDGELLGGADIVGEMTASGELHRRLGVPVPERRTPTFAVSSRAADHVHRLAARMNVPAKYELRLAIDAHHRNQLGFSPSDPNDVVVESNGIRILMDPATATRADGLALDAIETARGVEFRIGQPGEAAAADSIRQVSPRELRELLEQGVLLVDVRPPEERETARIEQARPLGPQLIEELEALDRDTPIAFHCHHGVRSQAAAEHFRGLGFRNLFNLAGGIDAWSTEIDPTVPRY